MNVLRYNNRFPLKVLNFALFPYRAIWLNPIKSTPWLLCLRDERMDYVSGFCTGKLLDIGCGPDNVFTRHFYKNGLGVDFFLYPGLEKQQIIEDPCAFPFDNQSFDTITLIANVNHIPTSVVHQEFSEIARILRPGGALIISRIGLIVSVLTHNIAKLMTRIRGDFYDMDQARGVKEDERYTVSRSEIDQLCARNGMVFKKRVKMWTQWNLNEILIYRKGASQ